MHDAEGGTARARRPRISRIPGAVAPGGRVRVDVSGDRTAVRVVDGPRGSGDVLLLHGIGLTADVNWAPAYGSLSAHARVIAPDHRGHGEGPSGAGPVTVERLADDAAAVLTRLADGPATLVGYSLGGLVAQVVWRRHPDLVQAMVLCSTAAGGLMSPIERMAAVAAYGAATASAYGASLVRSQMRLLWPAAIGAGAGDGDGLDDRIRAAVDAADPSAVCALAVSVGEFDATPWISDVDVPCAVVVTGRDRLVPVGRQREMAALVPGATVVEVDADHGFCVSEPGAFVPLVVEACRAVSAPRRTS